jgi:hypothetical protein
MSVLYKVSIDYQDSFVAILKWLVDLDIKCHSINYDFPVGQRPGVLDIEFNRASEALLFKLTWG